MLIIDTREGKNALTVAAEIMLGRHLHTKLHIVINTCHEFFPSLYFSFVNINLKK